MNENPYGFDEDDRRWKGDPSLVPVGVVIVMVIVFAIACIL